MGSFNPPEELMAKTELYILTAGKHHIGQPDGSIKSYKAGDAVPLTTDQYVSFKDRFKPRVVVEAEAAALKAQEEAMKKALSSEEPKEEPKAPTPTPTPAPAKS
jgi:fructose-specific phosphotransferase system component IIB